MLKLVETTEDGTYGPFNVSFTLATIYIQIDGSGTVELKASPEASGPPLPIKTFFQSAVDALHAPVRFLWVETKNVSGTIRVWFDGGR